MMLTDTKYWTQRNYPISQSYKKDKKTGWVGKDYFVLGDMMANTFSPIAFNLLKKHFEVIFMSRLSAKDKKW